MSAVPTPVEIITGLSSSSDFNAGVRDVFRFLLKPPKCELRQPVAQSIPNNVVFTAITFGAHDIDEDYLGGAMHSDSTNPSRATANFAGWYQVSGAVAFAANATGVRGAYIVVNGTAINGSEALIASAGAANSHITVARTKMVYLNVGDYVELQCYQNSGGALLTAVSGAVSQSSLSVRWVSN